jgi:hypothetical protein
MSGRRGQQRAAAAATYEQPDDAVLQVLSRELAGGGRPISRRNSVKLVHADELVRHSCMRHIKLYHGTASTLHVATTTAHRSRLFHAVRAQFAVCFVLIFEV